MTVNPPRPPRLVKRNFRSIASGHPFGDEVGGYVISGNPPNSVQITVPRVGLLDFWEPNITGHPHIMLLE